MEQPAPYIARPKLELVKKTIAVTYEYKCGDKAGFTIQFVDSEFKQARFPMKDPYTKHDWQILGAISDEIQKVEGGLL
jgi:hypothetical protein